MNKKDYSKVSKSQKSQKAKKVEEPVEVKEVEEVKVAAPEKQKEGVVNCSKLNVRKEPNKESEVLSIIDENKVVKILDDSDKVFYKVMISENIEGYCMKKFINIK